MPCPKCGLEPDWWLEVHLLGLQIATLSASKAVVQTEQSDFGGGDDFKSPA